jgi:hypothetical protein
MADVTLESLAERVAELERKLAGQDAPKKDWRRGIGRFAGSEIHAQVIKEVEDRREAERAAIRAEADTQDANGVN